MIPARSMARLLAGELGCRAEVHAAGRYVHVHYAGDGLGLTATLDLDRAFAYLQALRHGFRGRHTELPSSPTSVPPSRVSGRGTPPRSGPFVGGLGAPQERA